MTTNTDTGPSRPLRRRTTDRIAAGVCGGLADQVGIDIAIVRIAFVLLALLGGAGIPLYVAAWLLIPAQGEAQSTAERLIRR